MARKVKVNIPKGSKDCQGIECEQNLEFDIDIPDTIPTAATIQTPQVIVPSTAQPQQVVLQAPTPPPAPESPKEDKKLSHDEISAMIPKGVNVMECPGGDCGHKRLKNPTQTKKYKSCPGCEANTLTKDSDFCPYCSKNLDPEDLGDGIELEIEEEEND